MTFGSVPPRLATVSLAESTAGSTREPRPYSVESPTSCQNPEIVRWVEEVAALTQPSRVVWCDGSQDEWDRLTSEMVAAGSLIKLNPELRPNSYLARSDPGDVARVEDRTFICSEREQDAGPTNNWREPQAMREELRELFTGSMRGRAMYVVPFSMGPLGGPISQLGVQITDSAYAVLSMRVMTRIGDEALRLMVQGKQWVPALHSLGYPLIDDEGVAREDVPWPHNTTKYICHFPETREIWSYGSGYGGNALLGKKCFALRIASVMARDEGWLAEHMLIIKVTSPTGKVSHIAAAFPSACGKTNLAMLNPSIPGWRVETIGDDIAWMRQGPDGRLRAINPEAGFFGVAPGTGELTNHNAVATIDRNTIFTNVALTDDGDIWWEGLTDQTPEHLVDWQGNDWTPESGVPAAHPNGRFTVSAAQCPTIADTWDDPAGVPIDVILFGGRRATNVPLVVESRDWDHGVFIGATISSEKTAAQEGTVGELRRDPFAMLPFCGYNMADYWGHWLSVGDQLGENAPKIFQVNWFRKSADGDFLWPGFAENSRVIEWVIRRLEGEASGQPSPVGVLPDVEELNLDGLEIGEDALAELFEIDVASWLSEAELTQGYFEQFGEDVPERIQDQLSLLRGNLTR